MSLLRRVLGEVATARPRSPAGTRLNVGCGRNIRQGWVNLDATALPGVDIVADLDRCTDRPLPLAEDSIEEFLLSHVLEHIRQPLPLMQELWRIAKPGALMTVRLPYGSSDDAHEDPTHVRQYFLHSFGYFSQPFYWRADYGYRGDWQPEKIMLHVPAAANEGLTAPQMMERVMTLRNVVTEMVAELRCVKPLREPLAELRRSPAIELVRVQGNAE
jgi:hypothetical protein